MFIKFLESSLAVEHEIRLIQLNDSESNPAPRARKGNIKDVVIFMTMNHRKHRIESLG